MLDIVITGRHDNYGGPDFQDRLCAVAAHNHRLLTEAGVDHRFVLVEWNPVADRPGLADMVRARLPWWHRVLTVDRRWHERLVRNPRLEFMEFFAKNAAIRRSDADVVLATNSDVFLSPAVAARLATAGFEPRVVYRARRIDIDRRAPWSSDPVAACHDATWRLRVNDPLPPDYANSAGDFLLLTRAGWQRLGGFNEHIRFARIHVDGQFCHNADQEGFGFEILGPVFHIDHDGSYANAGDRRGATDAHYGPEWDYHIRYRNPRSWGLSAAIAQNAGNGTEHLYHPSTHGPLLSLVLSASPGSALSAQAAPSSVEVLVADPAGGTAALNEALAYAHGRFVLLTADSTAAAFGGVEALLTLLATTTAGLIAPPGGMVKHPRLGSLLAPGCSFVVRRDALDALVELDEREADPAVAFWLHASDLVEVAEAPFGAMSPAAADVRVRPGLELATLVRRQHAAPATLVAQSLGEQTRTIAALTATVERWITNALPASNARCAIVGPDWATPLLMEAVHRTGGRLAGLFASTPQEAGTLRWNERFRPLADVAALDVAVVLTASGTHVSERLAELGCTATVWSLTDVDEPWPFATSELDALRRGMSRDLADGCVDRAMAKLPLLRVLDGERVWETWYAVAQACERAGRTDDALRLFRDIMSGCRRDVALAMRATFHVGRVLAASGDTRQAGPVLRSVLLHNPAHGKAREILNDIERTTRQRVAIS